ncbi:MAG: spore coat protein [Oscillospiraceae bacterium]|jgi:spore coat protein CotF|nr:spore coat protein [Oscillospiraceae bacterium]
MQEKAMVNDALSAAKTELTAYATAIGECANPQLRATIQEIRNSSEMSHYELFQLAQQKGFYNPATPATPEEISEVKSQFSTAPQ